MFEDCTSSWSASQATIGQSREDNVKMLRQMIEIMAADCEWADAEKALVSALTSIIEVSPEELNEIETLVNEHEFKCNVTRFRSPIDGCLWFDIPFNYDPFWNKKLKRS